jgi:hypothetical protein
VLEYGPRIVDVAINNPSIENPPVFQIGAYKQVAGTESARKKII